MSSLLTNLPVSLGRNLLSQWLNFESFSRLDVAHCGQSERRNFSELLNGFEVAKIDRECRGEKYIGVLSWMSKRRVQCANFKLITTDPSFRTDMPPLSPAEVAVIDAYIQNVAGSLRDLGVICYGSDLTAILRSLAAHKCTLSALYYSTVMCLTRADQNNWVAPLEAILTNSAPIMADLHSCSPVAFEKLAASGVCFPQLRKVHLSECSDERLLSLFQIAPNLLDLEVPTGYDSIPGFAAIGTHCTRLETFRCSSVTTNIDEGIVLVVRGCRKLKNFLMAICMNVTQVALTAISAHCTQLEELQLDYNPHITDAWLVALAESHNHTLQSLRLRGCRSITGTGIAAIATHCTRLHTLDISNCEGITNANLRLVIAQLKCVKVLKLGSLPLDDAMLELIANSVSEVEKLHISVRQIEHENLTADYSTAGLLRIAQKCEKLKHLVLGEYGPELTDFEYGLWMQLRPDLVILWDECE